MWTLTGECQWVERLSPLCWVIIPVSVSQWVLFGDLSNFGACVKECAGDVSFPYFLLILKQDSPSDAGGNWSYSHHVSGLEPDRQELQPDAKSQVIDGQHLTFPIDHLALNFLYHA